MTVNHWSNHLVRGFTPGEDSQVTITLNPTTTHPSMVVVASRIAGLIDALGPTSAASDKDPLAAEDTSELGRLLDHLHRTRMQLEKQEERLIELLAGKGVSTRTIALHLEVAPNTVSNRLKRIEQARERGLSAAGLNEHDGDDSDVPGGDLFYN